MTNFHMTGGDSSGCRECFLGAGQGVEIFLEEGVESFLEEGVEEGETEAAFALDLEG